MPDDVLRNILSLTSCTTVLISVLVVIVVITAIITIILTFDPCTKLQYTYILLHGICYGPPVVRSHS